MGSALICYNATVRLPAYQNSGLQPMVKKVGVKAITE